jgi:hypothetical protein
VALLAYDRIALALLSCHRLIVTKPEYEYGTISAKGDSKFHHDLATWEGLSSSKKVQNKWNFVPSVGMAFTNLTEPLKALEFTTKNFQDIFKEECRNQKHFIPSSAGPNGKSGWTAYSDAVAILQDHNIFKFFRSLLKACGMNRFYADFINTIQVKGHDMVLSAVVNLGKIHTFAEWGGKTRHVAIVDYWTQLIMSPLHNTIFYFLKRLPMDCTHDQDKGFEQVKRWSASKTAELNSFDLTAATDRLPSELQLIILSTLLDNSSYAVNWSNLLSQRPYETETGRVFYGCGLPMGAKSN